VVDNSWKIYIAAFDDRFFIVSLKKIPPKIIQEEFLSSQEKLLDKII